MYNIALADENSLSVLSPQLMRHPPLMITKFDEGLQTWKCLRIYK